MEEKILGKILYGSQNYGLENENSDEDWYEIILPSAKDLFFKTNANFHSSDEHINPIEVRKWFSLTLRANPNFMELLDSQKVEFYDADWRELYLELKENSQIILQSELKSFFYACIAHAKHALSRGRREKNNKYLATAALFLLQAYEAYETCGVEKINWKKFEVTTRGIRYEIDFEKAEKQLTMLYNMVDGLIPAFKPLDKAQEQWIEDIKEKFVKFLVKKVEEE